MQQLRWTLLVLGALFIAVLAWWERRSARSRQDAGAGHDREGYREAGAAAARAGRAKERGHGQHEASRLLSVTAPLRLGCSLARDL